MLSFVMLRVPRTGTNDGTNKSSIDFELIIASASVLCAVSLPGFICDVVAIMLVAHCSVR